MNVVEKAKIYAHAAHAAVGQVRKYSGVPYIVHPAEVAKHVEDADGTAEMVAAAWLHDTVEDTDVTFDALGTLFPETVVDYVQGLTNFSKQNETGLNRAGRKAVDRVYLVRQSLEVQAIKCADIYANTRSITEEDPKFAQTYLEESLRLLISLRRAKDSDHGVLWFKAFNAIVASIVKLHNDGYTVVNTTVDGPNVYLDGILVDDHIIDENGNTK